MGEKNDTMTLKRINRRNRACSAEKNVYALLMVYCLPPWACAMGMYQIPEPWCFESMPETTEMNHSTPGPTVARMHGAMGWDLASAGFGGWIDG